MYKKIKLISSQKPWSWAAILLVLAVLSSCNYNGQKNTGAASQYDLKLEELPDQSRINVLVGRELFTSYMYADTFEKPFLFPLVAASGTVVSRGYPIEPQEGESVDHPHHTGFWFTYGYVNGIDYWGNSKAIPDSLKSRYGILRMKSIDLVESKRDKGVLQVSQEWVAPDGSIPLHEEITFVFTAGPGFRCIDRKTTFTTSLPGVSFQDTKEGALAIRVAKFLEFPSDHPQNFMDAYGNITDLPAVNNEGVNGNYLSSEGVEGASVWGSRAKWMSLYGVKGQDSVSVVIMDHPSNLNYPTYWHARTYGLFSANPFGVVDFTEGKESLNYVLKSGESLTFMHRLYIRSGEAFTADEIEEVWESFSSCE